MFTPAEAQLLHAFLKNAKPQATNMEQAVREAINYQRCVDLVNRETKVTPVARPPQKDDPPEDGPTATEVFERIA